MKISRRQLLQLGLLQAGAVALPLPAGATLPLVRRAGPSILQGATDESRTQFSIVHPVNTNYSFQVFNSAGQVWYPDANTRYDLNGQKSAITKVYFSKLNLYDTYTLSLFDASSGNVIEQRQFQMLDTKKEDLRFAICSCMDDGRHSPEIWQDLVAQQPNFIIFAGDSTYCDYGSGADVGESRLWRRFAEARATLEIYFSYQLIPIFATWDDHDFGANDTGRDYPYVLESQKNFMQFFAMEESHCMALQRGPGVSSRLLIGQQQFMLMDDRSWRVAGQSNERYAHWGQQQEEWLMQHVSNHQGMTWIVNGSQVFPQMSFKQSLSGEHPQQFAGVAQALSQMQGRVAFISGDVHFSEVSQIESAVLGYPTYELTSSSMHSSGVGPGLMPNPRRIASTGQRNYLLVQSQPHGSGVLFQVESRTAWNKVFFSLQLSI